ncbi:MAG: hypothetical protein WD359_02305 [Dehalococcoidia bacterium]
MTAEFAPASSLSGYKLDRDVFLVNQKHLSLGKSKYFVYGEAGEPLFYVERPVMRLFGRRADISFFEDESGGEPVLTLKQDHGYEFRRREYTLVDASGATIARLRRDNIKALFRRAWNIEDPDGNLIARALEDSAFMSVVRRVVDWIPFVALLGFVIKTDFHILASDGPNETKIGSFDRKIGLGDKYVLNLREDASRRFDRRIAVALGILLDTAEAR